MNIRPIRKAVMLGRHNLRSPIFGTDSELALITPHQWIDWPAPAGELSPKGAHLETELGAYFREYFIARGLFTPDTVPDHVRFRAYANSMQRAIATGNAFMRGMLPGHDFATEHHFAPGTRDPIFSMRFPAAVDRLRPQITAQMLEAYAALDPERSLRTLEYVLDYADSPAARASGSRHFRTDDLTIILEQNIQPKITGGFKSAVMAMDALILQYYEESDPVRAAFGHVLSSDDLQAIGRLYGMYQNMLFTIPTSAYLLTEPLIREVLGELTNTDRVFAALFGHDCNITGLLTSMRARIPDMPETLTPDTPIGCKLLFEESIGPDGTALISVRFFYQTTDQILQRIPTSVDHPPMSVPIDFNDMDRIAPGVYRRSDIIRRLTDALSIAAELNGDRCS